MLKKILVVIAVAFSGYCLANNNCEITHVSKEYKATTKAAAPLVNLFNKELSFRTPVPYKLMAADSIAILFYKNNNVGDKIISYFTIWQDIDGYSPKALYTKAFGFEKTIPNDKTIAGARAVLNINCSSNNYQEIKLENVNYKVLLSEKDTDTDKYNAYIIPNATNKLKVVYFIQFKNFDKSEIGNILSTMEQK